MVVVKLGEMKGCVQIFWIEGKGRFKRFGGGSEVARMFLRGAEEKTRTGLRREKFDGPGERSDGGGGIGFEQEDAEIELGFGHFGIEGDSFFVLGARVLGLLKRGVDVAELEVGVSEVVFFGEEFLERREGSLEIVAFDGDAGLFEKIVERIADDAARTLCGRFCRGFS